MSKAAVIFLLIAISGCVSVRNTDTHAAYRVFTSSGKAVTFGQLLKESDQRKVILFGEQHDNPMAHWLQGRMLQHIIQESTNETSVCLGMEMFERHQQQGLNKYLSGEWTWTQLSDSLSLWNNAATDYKPILDIAREHDMPVVASNITRKYASLVYHHGYDSLLAIKDTPGLPSLPIEFDSTQSQYKAMTDMVHGHGDAAERLIMAQIIKDATMGESILKQTSNDCSRMLHINGAYHSNFYQGIYWYLKKEMKTSALLTINVVTQKEMKTLKKEHHKSADYIIVTPDDMIRTH